MAMRTIGWAVGVALALTACGNSPATGNAGACVEPTRTGSTRFRSNLAAI